MFQGRSAPNGVSRPGVGWDEAAFADEPATELMEMPRGAPLALVELGDDDLEPCDEAPRLAPTDEVTASIPPPLPVLFGGRRRPTPPEVAEPRRPPDDRSRQRWVANAVALSAAWGTLLLLGVCVALAVLARTAV